MKRNVLIFLMVGSFVSQHCYAQQNQSHLRRYFDLTTTAGKSQGIVAAAFGQHWKVGKKRNWEFGLSARLSIYSGTKRDFITAPARLARTSTTPFLIFFAGQKTENHDTLTVQRPFTSSLNLALNAGYNISPRFYAGFNIDLVGFTIGRKTSAILTSNGTTRSESSAKPANFNLLLTGDHDLGTLNSEFFLQYSLNESWSLKAVYQFYFVEYKTQTIKQTAPDGTMVNRFRNKVNAFGVGVVYNLKK